MSDDQYPDGLVVRPLHHWPGPRTAIPGPSPFSAPLAATLRELDRELRAVHARNAELQVAIRPGDFRIDGRPKLRAVAEHPGVVLALDSRHGPLSYPCDTYHRWQDNLRAIVLSMEALRRVDRYGVTKRGEQYRGFAALPAGRSDDDEPKTPTEARELVRKIIDLPGEQAVREDHVREALKAARGDEDELRRVVAAKRVLVG